MGLKAVANLGGGGGGGISGSGTPGKLAKFTGATALGDSLLSESGTTITSAATAETFGGAQTWTFGAPNSFALIVKSNAGPESTLVLDTIIRGVGIGGSAGTLLHVQDNAGFPFAGSTYEGVRLQRSTEALFSASDYTRSFRAGLTGSTAVVGTSTAHDLLLQRDNVTAATLQSGAIATVTLTAGGTLYTNGTYSQQALTGGTGTGATADIVVAGGIVTSCVLRSPGTGYTAADALSCATIGAGAGFVVTVATIAQIVAGSGNLTALGRIGAGTATPRAPLDAIGGAIFDGSSRFAYINGYYTVTGALTPTSSPVGLVITGTTDLSSFGTSFFYPLLVNPLVTNLTGTMQAAHARSIISSSSGAVATVTGLSIVTSRQSVSDLATMYLNGSTVALTVSTGAGTAASYNQNYMRAFNGSLALQAPGTTTEATFFRAALTTASTPTATTLTAFLQEPTTISTAATIATAYGLRLGAYTLSGGAIITNRWGISQEDTLAKNYFAGNVGIGTTSPASLLTVNGNLAFNSGYGSAAVAYGCRVWINFIGATAVIRGSGGVSSLTRASAGTYTINYTTTMPDTGYAAIATKQSVGSNSDCQLYDLFASRTTTSSTWVNVEGAAVADSANINIAFFR